MLVRKVVIIEDDLSLAEVVFHRLATSLTPHFEVKMALTGEEGLKLCARFRPDVAVIDLNLPSMDGFTILRHVRRELPSVKCCVISGNSDLEKRLACFAEGADDFILKPFSGRELVARVAALSSRDRIKERDLLSCGPLTLNSSERKIIVNTFSARLSYTEHEVLVYLLLRSSAVVSRHELLETVWAGKDRYPNIVDATIENLRKKIRMLTDEVSISTVYRIGYTICENK